MANSDNRCGRVQLCTDPLVSWSRKLRNATTHEIFLSARLVDNRTLAVSNSPC
jgi:hypothetical protein